MKELPKKVLVIGIGNILFKDDGVGSLVVKELAQHNKNANITFLDGGTLGLDLIAYLEGYDLLLLVDALDIGQQPGSIFYWEGEMLNNLNYQMSIHEVGIKDLLQAIKLMGINIKVVLVGIQVEDISWGMDLSEAVQEAIPYLKKEITNILDQYLSHQTIS